MAHLEKDLKGAYILKELTLKNLFKRSQTYQLSSFKVKTHYYTKLDEKLLINLKKKYTVLFKEPNESAGITKISNLLLSFFFIV